MAETKAERRAAWKRRTTKTARALRKAKATVTRKGKRTIPLSARTPEEIRVAAFRAEHPERVVVDPVTGKHTRIDVRTGKATVISEPRVTPAEAVETRIIDAKMADAQRLAAERERAAAGAAIVAEARARPPVVTEPTYRPTPSAEVVTTVYTPVTKTLPEIFMGVPGVLHEHIERIIPAEEKGEITKKLEEVTERMSRGFAIIEEKTRLREVGVVADVEAKAINILTEKYLHATESVASMLLGAPRAVEIGIQQPTAIPARGMELLYGTTIGAAGYAVTDPVQFGMEAALIGGVIKAPSVLRPTKVPLKVKAEPSYDPMGFPVEFKTGKPFKKFIKETPERFKEFLESEYAELHIKKPVKKVKVDIDKTLKEKWAKREKELEAKAKREGYTVTKEGQILIQETKQVPVLIDLLRDPIALAQLKRARLKPKEKIALVEEIVAKEKVYPKVERVSEQVSVYIQKPVEVVKVFEPIKKEVSPQRLAERTHAVQSLKELQRLKSISKQKVETTTKLKSLQKQRAALIVLLTTVQTPVQKQKAETDLAFINTEIASLITPQPFELPPPPKYVPPPKMPPKPPKYVPPPEIPPKPPYKYVPPPVSILEEIPPVPKALPARPKLEKPKKRVDRVIKETPGYAWELANPIASLEQLLGGETPKRKGSKKTKKKSTKSRK